MYLSSAERALDVADQVLFVMAFLIERSSTSAVHYYDLIQYWFLEAELSWSDSWKVKSVIEFPMCLDPAFNIKTQLLLGLYRRYIGQGTIEETVEAYQEGLLLLLDQTSNTSSASRLLEQEYNDILYEIYYPTAKALVISKDTEGDWIPIQHPELLHDLKNVVQVWNFSRFWYSPSRDCCLWRHG